MRSGTWPRTLFAVAVAFIAMAMAAVMLPLASAAQTIPQHELLIGIDFDGTPAFSATDPADDGLGGHTPGEDLGPNNNVLRTNDQIQYNMSWNVNEADATDVLIKVSLPPNMEWLPDATTVNGAPAGCTDDGSSTINVPNPGDLYCIIQDPQIEGSNGTIHPRALLKGELDGVLLGVQGTIESNENTTPEISNLLETTVSAAPRGDWIKGKPITDAVSGDIIAYEPDEEHFNVLDENGIAGRLFVWNLRLIPTGGLKGAEPINDAIPIQLFDHFFDTTPGARLATAAMMPPNNLGQPRLPCGGYDGDDGYPYGQTVGGANATPAAQTNIGLWQCTDISGAYPMIQIDITGHDTQNIAPQNADMSPNGGTLTSGQVAFWAPEQELRDKLPVPAIIVNAITGTNTTVPLGATEVDPIQVAGTNGPVDESTADSASGGAAGLSNDSPYEFPPEPPGAPGRSFRHYVSYKNGPFQLMEYPDFSGKIYQNYDDENIAGGGTGYHITDGTTTDGGWGRMWDGDGQTPRGNVLTVEYNVSTVTSSADPPVVHNEPIHGCVAIDTTHQEVVGLPPTFPITVRGYSTAGGTGASHNTYSTYNRPIVGGATGTPTTPLVNVLAGKQAGTIAYYGTPFYGGVTLDRGELDFVVEFAVGTNPGNSVGLNSLQCNGDDAVWLEATAGNLAAYQTGAMADGTPIYGGITHIRVRTAGDSPWAGNPRIDGANASVGSTVNMQFQVRVKDDPSPGAQEADQELIIYGARASGVWDGTGQPPTPECTGGAFITAGGYVPTDGWCNLPFVDDGASSTDVGDQFNEFDGQSIEVTNSPGDELVVHADKIFIVEAALALSKTSPGGTSQIVQNGSVVEFEVNPKIVGSSLDEIDNVVVTDTLPATMVFLGFTQNPSVGTCSHSGGTPVVDPNNPAGTITAGGTITCTYGDDYNGGWGLQDEGLFGFEVMIVGASADSTLTNTARITGVDSFDPTIQKKPATSAASVFTGAPFDESVIVKAIDTGIGDCTDYPAGPVDATSLDPQPADWVDRCEMIDFENAPGTGASTMGFTLEMANQGNTPLTNVRFVDVFPHNADEVEPISNTGSQGVPNSTLGDGRTPETDTAGTLSLGAFSGDVVSYWVTGDAPNTISRDPDYSTLNTTWCTPAGAYAAGPAGACPAAGDETAIYAFMEDIPVGGKITSLLTLDTIDHECDDIWTNTFGARVEQILLPVRSNDVSIMVKCEYDLALQKIIDPAWAPGGDWLTPGTSTVDFVIAIHNQGDPINNFEVTDYVDPTMFTFDPALNLGGNTLDGAALPFTWDSSGANPVVTVNDPAHPLHDPSSNLIQTGDVIEIPITLTIAAGFVGPDLDNYAEISYFDNDGDPSNGDSASGDVVDQDSLPDDSNGDALVDDELNSDITQGGPDEDDHDIASIPIYDLAIDKANPTMTQNAAGDWVATFDVTLSNEGNQVAYNVAILETPPAGLTYSSSDAGSVTTTDTLAAAVAVTDADPNYTVNELAPGDSVTFTITYDVTDLTAGPYVNSVQVDSFEDADGNNPPDADSAPGNDTDHTMDGDGDEDDDASEQINLPFDLALVKKPVPGALDFADGGVQNGDNILFEIEVFNQLATIEDFDIIDYLQAGWIFDPAVQVSPLFTQPGTGANGGPVLPFTWTLSGSDPVAVVDGVLAGGESVIIPIVLTADIPNNPLAVLENYAEILRFDDDGDPSNGDSDDGTVEDIDSTPDGSNDDEMTDDEYNNANGDEDDHDFASTAWYDVALEKKIFDGGSCVDGPVAITPATTTVEYCITVSNQGPTALTNVSFADVAPAGLTFSSTTLLPATVTDNGGGTYTIPSLASGISETVRIEYTVAIGDIVNGDLTNVAEVTEMFNSDGDPAPDVDSYTDDTPDSDDPTEDDEDAQTLTIPFDLAMTKTLGEINGDQVTMYLTIENQSIGVETIDITDYIDASMWEAFDPGLNPGAAVDAASTVADAYGFSWDNTDPFNPVANIAPVTAGDTFAYGETIVVPITLTIASDWVGPDLENTAEISNFDNDDDPSNGDASDGTLEDGDSTPDDEDGNGAGESFNQSDDETGEDGTAGGDEDDHDGVLIPIMDLALVKTLDPATTLPLFPGANVTFLLEVTNQGNVDVTDPTVYDYVDLANFGPFNTADNAPGTTTGAAALPYSWVAVGTDGEVTITGTLAPGETAIVPVTLRMSFAPADTTMNNTAEISGGTPTDENGDEVTDGDGNPLEDIDSNPDTDDDDDVVDGVTDNSGGDEDDHDIEEVFVATPGIDIEKSTNGVDSDQWLGEQIMVGDPVTWSYEVTNTGNTALVAATVTDSQGEVVDCGDGTPTIALLLPGESVTCTAEGVATEGAYENDSDVSGTPAWPSDPDADPNDPDSWSDDPDDYGPTGQDDVEADDPSHYFGTEGGLELEKATNGVDADTAPGVPLNVGDPVEWTYEVTNTSAFAMLNSVVTDSDPAVVVDCGLDAATLNNIPLLLPGETVTCTSTGVYTADAGQYMNDSTVEGTGATPPTDDPDVDPDDPSTWPTDPAEYDDAGHPPYTADDPSHYHALEGSLDLEKATNGEDSDTAPGQPIAPGDPVTWTYAVTNNSNMVLIDVTVNDSDPLVNPDCGDGSNLIAVLQPGETVVCEATGIATGGSYTNDSDTSGTPAVEDPDNPGEYIESGHDDLSDDDPSNYTGAEPGIDIEKDTNGEQADTGVGPFIAEGDPVTWTYEVTNTGGTPLLDVTVNDSDPAVSVDCGDGTNVIALLNPGQVVTCTATGTSVLGLYENVADVSGTPAWPSDPQDGCCDPDDPASWPTDAADFDETGQEDPSDEDTSHYHSQDGEVILEKATNGVDADAAPGVIVNPGDPVVWTYVVTNTSATALIDLIVSDDQGETVDCGDGGSSIDVLLPGESHECTAEGIAGEGGYTNVGSVTGTPATEDPDNPGEYEAIPGAEEVGADDPSNYTAAEPGIDIEKDTNGEQADTGVGPFIAEGDPVTWTYEVTNTGGTPLLDVTVNDSDPAVSVDCGDGTNVIALLNPGQVVTCTATGTSVLGLYENVADVSGTPAWPSDPQDGCCDPDDPASWPTDPADFDETGQEDPSDEDTSHYHSQDGEVILEKATNGVDADAAPGVIVNPGDPVVWTYVVTNTSATALIDLIVSDDQGETVDCGDGTNLIALLLPGQSTSCTAEGIAGEGGYTNVGSVTGTPATEDPDNPGEYEAIPGAEEVGDDDPSNYTAAEPGIDIEKATNGDDADNTSGPVLAPGDAVTWTYVVTNTGAVPLLDATVNDSDPAVSVDCGDGTNVIALLNPGQSATCTATGTAELGQYENIADVSGTPAWPSDPQDGCCDPDDPASWPTDPADFAETGQDEPTDTDASHYVAQDGDIMIEKSTNGVDADTAPGPVIAPGDPVTWSYVVTNTSAVPLINVTVLDDQGVPVDCGDGGSSIDVLLPGESHECTGTGIAVAGDYENVGTAVGIPALADPDNPGGYKPIPGATPAIAEDPSHYTGATPAVDLEKATNGVQSDTAPGEDILAGDPVEWTYEVTNTGDMILVDLEVDDSQGVAVDCGDGTNVIPVLAPGDSHTCTGSGIAVGDDYSNVGSVRGTPAIEDPANPGSYLPVEDGTIVADTDLSHYAGAEPTLDLALQKRLADPNNNTVAQTFLIEVFNQGNVDAANVVVTDVLPAGLTLDDTDWTDNGDGTASIVIPGPIAPGESVIVEIDVRWDGSTVDNVAGIESAEALHPVTGESLPLDDADSTPGDPSGDPMVDDELNNTGGDEDDSDLAGLTQPAGTGGGSIVDTDAGKGTVPNNAAGTGTSANAPTAIPFTNRNLPDALAFTGSEAADLTILGTALLAAGTALVVGTRRRRREDGTEDVELDWVVLDENGDVVADVETAAAIETEVAAAAAEIDAESDTFLKMVTAAQEADELVDLDDDDRQLIDVDLGLTEIHEDETAVEAAESELVNDDSSEVADDDGSDFLSQLDEEIDQLISGLASDDDTDE